MHLALAHAGRAQSAGVSSRRCRLTQAGVSSRPPVLTSERPTLAGVSDVEYQPGGPP